MQLKAHGHTHGGGGAPMSSLSRAASMGTLTDICKVLLCCARSPTHRHLRVFFERARVCVLFHMHAAVLGRDPGAPPESRVTVQESTSGPVRVYVH